MNPELLAWSKLPGPRKVLAAARARLEAGYSPEGRPLRVTLNSAEREQVGQLLGLSWARSGRAPGMSALSSAIAMLDSDLPSLLKALDGPLRDIPAERASGRQRAADERSAAAEVLVRAGVPAETVHEWLARRGLPRVGSGNLLELSDSCARVWRAIPGPGGASILRTVLAADVFGDPHALDRGTTIASGVLQLLGYKPRLTAEDWRAAWEDNGVACDPVSSRVLVLNLPLEGSAPAVRLTKVSGAEPLWLTWRALSGEFCFDGDVFVCENPSVVVAAADEHGTQCRPLVCVNGRPSAAGLRLVAMLARNGAALHVRADDDKAGQDIVSRILRAAPTARLWRYELRPPSAPKYEEQLIAELLLDLAPRPADTGPHSSSLS
jgi:uncharacterized protein (TIGR02679 family)